MKSVSSKSVPGTALSRASSLIGVAVVARTLKRYPIVAATLVVWRWWRRRNRRIERTTVQLGKNESISLQRRRAN
jgi:Flp pilus assembly protein TadB